MAYYIHNKYDKDSIAKVSHISGLDYVYTWDPSVTVIDYYGYIENGINTYKYIDTANMGKSVVAELSYITIDVNNLIGNSQTDDEKSIITYNDGIKPVLAEIKENIGKPYDINGSNSDGSIMAKLNKIIDFVGNLQYFVNKIVSSDDLLLQLSSTEVTAGSSETSTVRSTLSCNFLTGLTGTVKLRFEVKFPSVHGDGYVAVLKDGVIVGKTITFSCSTFSDYGYLTLEIPVMADGKYSIYIYGRGSAGYSGTAYLRNVYLYGKYVNGQIDYVSKV